MAPKLARIDLKRSQTPRRIVMKKSALMSLGLLALAAAAQAAEAAAPMAPAASGITPKAVAALGLAISGFGAAIGMGMAIAKAMEGIGRQPEAANSIRGTLLVALAFIEALTIYALLAYFTI
jgi:F-type H+-transporting ATPase subunit c